MRLTTFYSALSACFVLGNAANLLTLPEAVEKLPDCSLGAFRDGLKSSGCNVDKVDKQLFECMCTEHLGALAVTMSRKVPAECSADWSTSFGTMCGYWTAESDDSKQNEANKVLAQKLDGKSGDTKDAKDGQANDSKDGKEGAASRSSLAVGLAGGVIAVAVGFMV